MNAVQYPCDCCTGHAKLFGCLDVRTRVTKIFKAVCQTPSNIATVLMYLCRWCVEGSFQPSFFTPPPANEEDSKEDNSVPSVKLQLNFETPKGESSSLGTISSHGDG